MCENNGDSEEEVEELDNVEEGQKKTEN